MKILVVEYRDIKHPEAGGAELILFEIFSRFVNQNHTVDYLCSKFNGATEMETIDGINVIRTGNHYNFNFVVSRYYKKHLQPRKYDLIVEGIDKIPFFLPRVEKDIPILCIIPHLFGTTVFKEASIPIASYVYFWESFIPRIYKNSYFSLLSRSTKDDLIRRGISPDNMRVIYPGIDHNHYSAPLEKERNSRPTVVYLGRLKKYKGIDLGLQSIAALVSKYKDINYQIVGAGDFDKQLQNIVSKLNLDNNVTFLGHISGKEKVTLLQKCDVLIYPSPKEGWGLSVIEANACGTPAVASNSPGLRESVMDGKTGFLVQHGSVENLAEKIDILLSDRILYSEMRNNAIQWAKEFTWEKTAEDTLEFISEIIESGRIDL